MSNFISCHTLRVIMHVFLSLLLYELSEDKEYFFSFVQESSKDSCKMDTVGKKMNYKNICTNIKL